MNTFESFKKYLSSFKKGEIITRKEISKQNFWRIHTIDEYRLHFTHAGYLIHTGRGIYTKSKNISESLSSRDLRKEAYPHWRTWYEYKHLKNESSTLQT